MEKWKFGKISVLAYLSYPDDSDIDLVLKTSGIALDTGKSRITIQEKSNARYVEYWPDISLNNPKRRNMIYKAAIDFLLKAERISASTVGFYTTGLEAARIPSWEIAEELVRAVMKHSKDSTCIQDILFVASSPTQMSSFQFALNNSSLYMSVE